MNIDSYVSDTELDNIRKHYGEKIISFVYVHKEVDNWHKSFGTVCPPSCINNYRDSWFHFRKLWKERSEYEVISQMATLDEHLQRAEKDAVVSFFQNISQKVEYWYSVGDRDVPTEMFENIRQNVEAEVAHRAELTDRETVASRLWQRYQSEGSNEERKKGEMEASYALIYYAKTYIMSQPEVRYALQEILHKVKNATLEIRLESSNIDRTLKSGEYVKRYNGLYQELHQFFEENQNIEIFFCCA